jgi:hypothetical protein
MNYGIENGSPSDNLDHDRILIRIIKKYYPDLGSKKELKLLTCIGWTMKDFNWAVADAPEIEARMTLNLPWLEPNNYKPSHKQIQNRFPPDEYKDILSNLISKNILQEKTLETTYGSAPNTLIEYDQYLAFTNEDMTHELLANSEGLEQAVKIFENKLNNCDLTRSHLDEKERKKLFYLLVSVIVISLTCIGVQTDKCLQI